MADNRRFARLVVEDWRQFRHVDLNLTSRLTILTGANGTGKTSLLNILGSHFDWAQQFLATPMRDKRTGRLRFSPGLRRLWDPSWKQPHTTMSIGNLTYSDDRQAEIGVSATQDDIEYYVYVEPQAAVSGLYLTSHRIAAGYQQVQSIPAAFSSSQEILEQYLQEFRARFSSIYSRTSKSPMLLMKESLLAAAIYGQGNRSVIANAEAEDVWRGFQNTLTLLLPPSVRFRRLVADPPNIIMETATGSFPLDAVSGGLNALLELAWQVFLRSRERDSFTVCFDEPENHLHPSLQRSLMPSLLRAFPNVSFILATHSPFIVTSSQEANVYVLDYDDEGYVSAQYLDFTRKAASADETLRDVLGVPSTLPIWAEARFDSIVVRYLEREPTRKTLLDLRKELIEAGLGSELPEAVNLVTDSALARPHQRRPE